MTTISGEIHVMIVTDKMTENDKNVKKEESVLRKLDIPYDPDCVSCRIIGTVTLYGAGYLVLSNVRRVPANNKPGRVVMGLFGLGLLGMGTMRLFVR